MEVDELLWPIDLPERLVENPDVGVAFSDKAMNSLWMNSPGGSKLDNLETLIGDFDDDCCEGIDERDDFEDFDAVLVSECTDILSD